MGSIIEESILDYAESKLLGNIPHPSLINHLCIKGVQNSMKRRKVAARPFFSLVGALKALVESKEGERKENTRNRKRADTEVPKEPAPIVVAKEEANSEENRGFEAYLE